MAAVDAVFTLARVAEMLGEDEGWLHEIAIEMAPEDGLIWVYGTDGLETPAFSAFGIESLRDLIRLYDENPSLMPQRPSPKT